MNSVNPKNCKKFKGIPSQVLIVRSENGVETQSSQPTWLRETLSKSDFIIEREATNLLVEEIVRTTRKLVELSRNDLVIL